MPEQTAVRRSRLHTTRCSRGSLCDEWVIRPSANWAPPNRRRQAVIVKGLSAAGYDLATPDTIDLFCRSPTLLRMPSWLGQGAHEEREFPFEPGDNKITTGDRWTVERGCADDRRDRVLRDWASGDHSRGGVTQQGQRSCWPPALARNRRPSIRGHQRRFARGMRCTCHRRRGLQAEVD